VRAAASVSLRAQVMSSRAEVTKNAPEPRWQALIAILAVTGLYVALPPSLTFGPTWLLPILVVLLAAPLLVSHRMGRHELDAVLGFTLTAVLTAAMIASVAFLIGLLPAHKESPTELLRSAAFLWLSNVLVFALWYWRLDAGGPHARDARDTHDEGAFLFPQMLLRRTDEDDAPERWSPHFMDYLFLAFNTSTAFSPTDTAVLTRWAKVLMMLQSLISLTVLAVLAARAVNIL
jgi:uncharacterized membrane protein